MSDTSTHKERSLRASIGANSRWAAEPDRTKATEPARRGLLAKFEKQVDPDGTLPAAERARRAENALRAHMQRMSLAAAKARRIKSAERRKRIQGGNVA